MCARASCLRGAVRMRGLSARCYAHARGRHDAPRRMRAARGLPREPCAHAQGVGGGQRGPLGLDFGVNWGGFGGAFPDPEAFSL